MSTCPVRKAPSGLRSLGVQLQQQPSIFRQCSCCNGSAATMSGYFSVAAFAGYLKARRSLGRSRSTPFTRVQLRSKCSVRSPAEISIIFVLSVEKSPSASTSIASEQLSTSGPTHQIEWSDADVASLVLWLGSGLDYWWGGALCLWLFVYCFLL